MRSSLPMKRYGPFETGHDKSLFYGFWHFYIHAWNAVFKTRVSLTLFLLLAKPKQAYLHMRKLSPTFMKYLWAKAGVNIWI